MKETKKISMHEVRRMCINCDFYTCGDCWEYDEMLLYVSNIEHVTIKELETIAKNIKEHSETDATIAQIMTRLTNDCCMTFFCEEEKNTEEESTANRGNEEINNGEYVRLKKKHFEGA